MRLAIVSTHPIQYHGHWFRALAKCPGLDVEVFFCYYADPQHQAQAGFGRAFDWDIPLLEGYSYRFLTNVSSNKSPNGFSGLDTPQIGDMLKRGGYDAVLVNGWHYKTAWQTMLACWRTNMPVMVRSDSQLRTPRSLLKRWTKYPLYRFFIPRVNACLAVGTRAREYYLHYGARPEQIFIVPHSIDPAFFEHGAALAQQQRAKLREQWGFDQSATVFLFVGKFIDIKRPMDFLRGIEAAAHSGARIAGLMVGDGPLRRECELYAEAHKIPVSFAGFMNQSQIVQAYIAADALVLPSADTWGVVVNEAMSCGRPAIVSDAAGCAPDLIRSGSTGEIFPLGDVNRLARSLINLAGEPDRLQSMGLHARGALRPYSSDAAVRGVAEALSAVAGRK